MFLNVVVKKIEKCFVGMLMLYMYFFYYSFVKLLGFLEEDYKVRILYFVYLVNVY